MAQESIITLPILNSQTFTYFKSHWIRHLGLFTLVLGLSFSNTASAQTDPEIDSSETQVETSDAQAAAEVDDEEQQYRLWAEQTLAKLKPQTGDIELPNGVATLHVPEAFYYLNPEDAELVLTEIWGNPPSELTLGMLFPAGVTPFDGNAWGVTIEYVEDGYIDDSDAADIDYDDLLKSMKSDIKEASEYRVEQGYEPISLVGWAKQPYYNSAEKKLHWAKELQFGDDADNTLNYNIRVLGRKGYLLLNFIAGMDQLPQIEQDMDSILAIAEFKDGSKYSDFDPSIDKVAAYGIGALVAGKVIAKTGLIAAAILLLKKFGVFILLGIGALFKMVFGRNKKQ